MFVALDVLAAAYFLLAAIFIPGMASVLRDGKPSKLQTWWFYTAVGIVLVLFSSWMTVWSPQSDIPEP